MKKYTNKKVTNIDWIGIIPEHWKVSRLGYYATMIVPMRDKPVDLNGEIPWLRIEDFEGKYVEKSKSNQGVSIETINEMNLKVFPVGTVLCSCSCTMGKTAIVKRPLLTNQTFIGITPNVELMDSEYLYFLMSTAEQYLNSIASGAIQTYLSRFDFEKLLIPIPTLSEQIAIRNFLNYRIELLDELISKKQSLITLLKEERTAIINHAVTKGIDPKVKMKPSGVDWIGEIPENWEFKKLKYLLLSKKGALKTGPFGSDLKASDLDENGKYKVYGQKNVIENDFSVGTDFISEKKYEDLSSFKIEPNDILITTRGTIGKTAIFPTEAVTGVLHPCLIRIQINNKVILHKWLTLYFNESSYFKENVKLNSNSTIIDVIYGTTLSDVFIPTPPINEQNSIIEEIIKATKKIDSASKKILSEIILLQEYRTSLINEVVTGKICVLDDNEVPPTKKAILMKD